MYRTTLRNKALMTSAFLLIAPSLYTVDDPLELKVNAENSSLLMRVIQKSPEMKSMVFRPGFHFTNGHLNSIHTGLQTRWNNYFEIRADHTREIFKLSDGGEICLDFSVNKDKAGEESGQIMESAEKPLIVIIPGLLSSIEDHHINNFIQTAQENGYDWVLINYRGIQHPLKNGKPLSFQDVESFKEPLRYILDLNKMNDRKVFIFGSSLGGNFVANIICDEEFDTGRIAAVACLCPALDLEKSLKNCNVNFGGLYGWNFVSSFKSSIQSSKQSIECLSQEYNRKKSER